MLPVEKMIACRPLRRQSQQASRQPSGACREAYNKLAKMGAWPRSSDGQSSGFLNRWSGVRITPGLPPSPATFSISYAVASYRISAPNAMKEPHHKIDREHLRSPL
jgi:hypothetical protein